MKKRVINFKFIISIAIIQILCYMAVDMYLASMTDIAQHFEASYSKVQLSLTFYLFAMGIGQLFFGPIIDYFGRKKPLILGICLYAMCSFIITTSPNIELFIWFGMIQYFSWNKK